MRSVTVAAVESLTGLTKQQNVVRQVGVSERKNPLNPLICL